jgi:hypothetical protein
MIEEIEEVVDRRSDNPSLKKASRADVGAN